ncbi:MAG: RNA methyltransferase [Cyanobacteria bacterium SIG32]|nr:RNA methyltransferase [Cyanobacteria bacterium SIG32]
MEITSLNNDLVKETVKLQQKKYRTEKFLLEGYKAIEEAFNAGIKIDYAFVLSEKAEEYAFLGDKIILTNEPVLKKISTTDSAPDAVAVGYKKVYDKSYLKNAEKVVLLENIKDLGNLGTILRTSVAFGADAVVLYGESVDLYNPKCVRASVGNLWKIPVVEIKNFAELKQMFGGFERIATLPRTNNHLKSFDVKLPCVVMFGSEADGLSDELINWATNSVKIEMASTVESLNLSVSCAVVLYKLFV